MILLSVPGPLRTFRFLVTAGMVKFGTYASGTGVGDKVGVGETVGVGLGVGVGDTVGVGETVGVGVSAVIVVVGGVDLSENSATSETRSFPEAIIFVYGVAKDPANITTKKQTQVAINPISVRCVFFIVNPKTFLKT